jgi:diadenosine tetraphosphate (Ap4A) HIT family hydrolase
MMLPKAKIGFELDPRLERATLPVLWLGLCELRLQNDARWPWVVLVPQRTGVEEFHDLSPLDQAMLTFEANVVSRALKSATSCQKINIGMLGNVVPQLHLHVVARSQGDPNWPGPIWGFGAPQPYKLEKMHEIIDCLRSELTDKV